MDIGALIVDDESDIRLLLRSVIEGAGHGLFVAGEASSGAEAVEHAHSDDPLVIVLDHVMPEMGGVEAATIIRSQRPTQEIILCSAYLDNDLIDRARAAGVGHFLAKDQVGRLPALIHEVVGAPPRT
jgi:CheY-like chemotaxis protein